MKTLIIHNKGQIVMSLSNDSISMEEEYKCLVADIEENKEIVAVDVETNTVITKDKDTRVEDITTYLNNADNDTISKVEDTILEVESNKVTEGEE